MGIAYNLYESTIVRVATLSVSDWNVPVGAMDLVETECYVIENVFIILCCVFDVHAMFLVRYECE